MFLFRYVVFPPPDINLEISKIKVSSREKDFEINESKNIDEFFDILKIKKWKRINKTSLEIAGDVFVSFHPTGESIEFIPQSGFDWVRFENAEGVKLYIIPNGVIEDLEFFLNIILKTNSEKLKEDTELKKPLFIGKVEKIEKDLGLMISENFFETTYYEAGVFNDGELEGYTRIIARFRTSSSAYHSWRNIVFATKDFENFVIENVPDTILKEIEGVFKLDYTKILKITEIEIEHPKEIELNGNFILKRSKYLNFGFNFEKKGGIVIEDRTKPTWEDRWTCEYKEEILDFTFENLEFFNNASFKKWNLHNPIQCEKEDYRNCKENEFCGDSWITVIDTSGLSIHYYLAIKDTGEINVLNAKNIEKTKDIDFYEKYSLYDRCDLFGKISIGGVLNISDEELEQLPATYKNVQLYKLKDTNHSALKKLYSIGGFSLGDPRDNIRFGTNEYEKVFGTYDEFVDQNPILFIQDFWKRWIGFSTIKFNELDMGCDEEAIRNKAKIPLI